MAQRRAFDEPASYHIRVAGTLDLKWGDWFDGFTILPQANGETLLTGSVADQAALHGLLRKIGDLGLSLLLVRRVENRDAPSGRTRDEEHGHASRHRHGVVDSTREEQGPAARGGTRSPGPASAVCTEGEP